MRPLLLSFVLASAAAPALGQPSPTAYEQAVAARKAGNPALSVALLGDWLATRPTDVDARLNLGLSLLALGRLEQAERAFNDVLTVAPDYHDARLGLAQVAYRKGDPSVARAQLALVPANYPEARELRSKLQEHSRERWALDINSGVSAVGRGQPDWKEIAGELRYTSESGFSAAGRIEATERFDLRDAYGEARLGLRVSRSATAYALVGGTPDADYRPIWQMGAGGSLRLRSGPTATVATLDLRHAHYQSGAISSINPGIEQYFAGGKAWGTVRLITLIEDGNVEAGGLGRIDVQTTPDLRVFAGYADAPDTSEGVVTRVSSMFGGAEFSVSRRQTLRLSLAHTDQEAGANRTEVSLGTRVKL